MIQNDERLIQQPPFAPPGKFNQANVEDVDLNHMDPYNHDELYLLDCYTESCPSCVSKFQAQLDIPDLDLTPLLHSKIVLILLVDDGHYDGLSKLWFSNMPIKVDPTIYCMFCIK